MSILGLIALVLGRIEAETLSYDHMDAKVALERKEIRKFSFLGKSN